jgi:hypothetical protein
VFYTIYKTTNLVNNKFYIGKHQTKEPNDTYLGSGKYLGRAIEKHGRENFHKEILHIFDTEEEMNAKEVELVTENFVKEDTNYNLCPGGQGGWGYINVNNLSVKLDGQRERDISFSRRSAIAGGKKQKYLLETDPVYKKEFSNKVSKGVREYLKENSGSFKGRKHTEETLAKMRKSKNKGDQNPQFGSMWITDGLQSKKISKDAVIPDGWTKGRKMTKTKL